MGHALDDDTPIDTVGAILAHSPAPDDYGGCVLETLVALIRAVLVAEGPADEIGERQRLS
jgi:hypothetical protein